MKIAVLFVAMGFGLQSVQAQTVPLLINYQGKVTDSAGVGLGTGAAINRKIIFRIYDASTGGTRIWTEEQTVTLSGGEFSVLLGNGIAGSGTAAGESRPALDTVFITGNSNRYLGITVDNGDGNINASDVEIGPRQQITTTAYSFRARSADTIATGSDLQLNGSANYGLGYYGSGRLFNGAAIDGPVLFGQGGGLLGAVNGSTQTPALRWNEFGQIGVGTTTLPGAGSTIKLTLQGDDANNPPQQLSIRGNTDPNKRLLLGYNTTNNFASLQAYTAVATAGSLALNASGGNVGIGTTTPAVKLDVNGAINASSGINGSFFVGQGSIAVGGASGHIFSTNDTDGGLFSPADGVITLKTNNVEQVRVDAAGFLGLGTSAPVTKFHLGGGTMWLGESTTPALPPSAAKGLRLSYDSGADAALLFAYNYGAGGGTRNMLLQTPGGRVGIGTVNPTGQLHVEGGDRNSGLVLRSGQPGIQFYNSTTGVSWNVFTHSTGGGLSFFDENAGSYRMVIDTSGRVGINGTPTRAMLDVNGTSAVSLGANKYFDSSTGNITTGGGGSFSAAVYGAGWIVSTTGFVVSSDERIKQIEGVSDGGKDLETLRGIRVTDYRHKDTVAYGDGQHKMLIAQQLEKVYPQAVRRSADVIPDLYQRANFQDGWVQLATDLQKGERVRLVHNKGAEVYEVLEAKPGAFRTNLESKDVEVFVYGREVQDFRTVDYSAVSMLNVSATQQLDKQLSAKVDALQTENDALRARLAAHERKLSALEAKDQARDAKLAALEKLLLPSAQPVARTVVFEPAATAQ